MILHHLHETVLHCMRHYLWYADLPTEKAASTVLLHKAPEPAHNPRPWGRLELQQHDGKAAFSAQNLQQQPESGQRQPPSSPPLQVVLCWNEYTAYHVCWVLCIRFWGIAMYALSIHMSKAHNCIACFSVAQVVCISAMPLWGSGA